MKYLELITTFFLVACQPNTQAKLINGAAVIVAPTGEQVRFTVEVADEPAERSAGLMHRTELAEDEGMLFVFEEEKTLSFWMKNTLVPLDILFFANDGTFVSWETMQPCTEDPCPQYVSNAPAKYALEMSAGLVKELMIRPSWRLLVE